MGIISKDTRKITLYYHSATSLGKQTYAYVISSKKHVLAIDIAKTVVTGTQWVELADGLGMEIADLVNKDHSDFKTKFGKGNLKLGEDDWLKILKNNSELLICPIVIIGGKFIPIKTPSRFVGLPELDSSGI
ncbi:hypothetical protein MWU78_04495 [Arenibacter sp. F26102]|uniref:arsenate reductase family protein n=1 Tax=Arenibacter sp. F26102 TaxID=2926416 RepID=UPI001FF65851|nr:hypothetical protein [Arenibacter sp. F26102]MCK0144904.1 hypothetical protein [Arenibacter sp. F26102]